jgi:uncharacterized protein
MLVKPDDVFDRNEEWAELERHVIDGRARLGIVTGRRRVGKTFLLRRLAAQYNGLLVTCLQEERLPALQRFAVSLGEFHGIALGAPADWQAAISQATTGPLAVPLLIIDELPYLLDHSPELESILQHAVDASRDDAGTRIILAGSSLAVMGGLLDGSRPLRGRADLQLKLEPFDYRTAAAFWEVDDPSLAFRMHAILGGSPGYRALVTEVPRSINEFDGWVERTLLNPASALFHEDAYLLAEDRRLSDRAVYGSVLRAVAEGEHRPSRIGGRVGRPQTSLSHVLGVLGSAGFLINDTGVLSGRDPLYRIADEMILFIRACVDPWRGLIEEKRQGDAWNFATATWNAAVLGPHLERIAQVWANRFASTDLLGGPPGIVGRADIPDPQARVTREIDLVVLVPGSRPGGDAQVMAIGEVKLQADVDAVVQLDRCAELVEKRGHGRPTRLLLIAESFSPSVERLASSRSDLRLVSLAEMYAVENVEPGDGVS